MAAELLKSVKKGMHVPVDDLRFWVRAGLSDAVPWTEETERQFRVAELAAMRVAQTYADAGFEVVVDHCRRPATWDETLSKFPDLPARKVLLLPDMEVNLARNATRTDKTFDPAVLEDTIRFTNDAYREGTPSDWLVVDNTHLDPRETADRLISRFAGR